MGDPVGDAVDTVGEALTQLVTRVAEQVPTKGASSESQLAFSQETQSLVELPPLL